jgi:hypothetical protein
MAGSRTGTPTIIKLARKICRLKSNLGASNLEAATSTEFAAAVLALQIACIAFEAADNYPAQIDRVNPAGPED